jgi:hypothetical protein
MEPRKEPDDMIDALILMVQSLIAPHPAALPFAKDYVAMRKLIVAASGYGENDNAE